MENNNIKYEYTKTPLDYQITEYDCGTTTLLNALRYLFKRSEISPEIYKYIIVTNNGTGTVELPACSYRHYNIDDMTILKEYASMMFGVGGVSVINNHALYYLKNYLIIFILAIIFSMPVYKLAKEKLSKVKNTKSVFIVSLIIYTVLFIVVVSYLVNDTYNPFLYFRF